ncbi:MAG: hypothetical protein QM667_07945 [Asticcacaulis sp.]
MSAPSRPPYQSAWLALRFGPCGMRMGVRVTPEGILATGVLVTGVLLSTALIVAAAKSSKRLR